MSKYDKASLVHIPSGYKSGTLYNVLPNDADGDFDYSGGTNGTRVDKDGLIEEISANTPRLDYPLLDGVVQDNPTLLLEPAATNLLSYSEDFSQWWSLSNITQSSNQVISPDGGLNADKIIEDNSNTLHRINTPGNFINTGVTTNKVFSVFVKKDEITRIGIVDFRYSNGLEVEFNLKTKSIGRTFGNLYVSAKIEEYPNDWLRCTVVYDTEALTSMAIVLLDDNYDNTTKIRDYTYQGDGTSGFYVWGAELKVGNPTSYIPTSGSSVTRSADAANGAGTAADFNDSEGVLYANVSALAKDTNYELISISDGTNDIHVDLGFNNSTTESYKQVKFGADNVFGDFTDPIADQTTPNKMAVKYKSGDSCFYVNGFKIDSSSTAFTPTSSFNELKFSYFSGSDKFYGNTKEVIAFNEALSDTELEALTSYDSFKEMATEQLYTIE